MGRMTSELVLSLLDRLSGPAKKATASIRGIGRAVMEANGQHLRAMSEANIRNIKDIRGQLLATTATAFGLGLALAAPYRAARDFQSGMTDIKQKAEISDAAVAALGLRIRKLAPQINQTASEVQRGLDILLGFGMDVGPSELLMRPIGKAATAYKAEIADLANMSYALVNNLKLMPEQVAKALDVTAQAGKEGAFELKDMARYFPELTAQAQALGQTGVPAVADLSAALEVVRQGVGESSEAVTNLSDLMSQLKAPRTLRAFARQGVDLIGSLAAAAKKGLVPLEAITEITRSVINTKFGGDVSRIRSLFGNEQAAAAVRLLIQNTKQYRDIREKAGKALGVVDRDFIDRMKNAEAAQQANKVAAQEAAIAFGNALLPAITAVMQAVTPMLNVVGKLASRYPVLTRGIIGTVTALVALRIAMLATQLAKAQFAQGLIEMGIAVTTFGPKIIAFALTPLRALIGLLSAAAVEAGLFGGILGAASAKSFGAALLALLNPMRLVRGSLTAMKFSLRGLLVGTGIGILLLMAGWLVENWSKVSAFFKGFGKGFMAALAPVRPALQPLINVVKAVVGWIGNLLNAGGTDASWEQWGERAGRAVGGVVVWIAELIGKLGEAINKLGEFWDKLSGNGPPQVSLGQMNAFAHAKRPPHRKAGGRVSAGGMYEVNEAGMEIFRPGRSGTVYPNRELGKLAGAMGAGGRGQRLFAPTLHVHGAGADPAGVADLVMARMRAEWNRFQSGTFADEPLRA